MKFSDIYAHSSIPDGVFLELRTEATHLKNKAIRSVHPNHFLDSDGGIHGRVKLDVAGPGAALIKFHNSIALVLAKNFAGIGNQVFPSRCSYLYYRSGDFAVIHNDVSHANITILTALSGNIQPLIMYPRFGKASLRDARLLDGIGNCDYDEYHHKAKEILGKRMEHFKVYLEKGVSTAIRGRKIPHGRYRQTGEAIVCATCFSVLEPKHEWTIS